MSAIIDGRVFMRAVSQVQPSPASAVPDEQGRGLAFAGSSASAGKALAVWGIVLATLLAAIAVAATATVFAWPAVA
jgi:hypothetical protein